MCASIFCIFQIIKFVKTIMNQKIFTTSASHHKTPV